VLGAAALMIVPAGAFQGTALAGQFSDALTVAQGLAQHVGHAAGAIFALVLIDASIIGASAVTLATSYAFGDVFGIRHSLHRSWREAKPFYAAFTATVTLAAAIVLLPGAPLGLITLAVQALAGTLLPGASLFLLLLCNDRAVLGPWVNRAWLNVVATLILAVLVELSLILVISTIFPDIDVVVLFEVLSAVLAAGLVVIAVLTRGGAAPAPLTAREARAFEDRESWRMPPIALLTRPAPSRGRQVALWSMRGYLIVAMLLLLVKAIQLGTGR
jgi:hypothetical protein